MEHFERKREEINLIIYFSFGENPDAILANYRETLIQNVDRGYYSSDILFEYW